MREKARWCSAHRRLCGRYTCLCTCSAAPVTFGQNDILQREPLPSMQWRAALRSLLTMLPFHRARRIQPVILAQEI